MTLIIEMLNDYGQIEETCPIEITAESRCDTGLEYEEPCGGQIVRWTTASDMTYLVCEKHLAHDEYARLVERCDGCGEAYDEDRPNAGDGWAEMADPNSESVDEHFIGHYSCGLEKGYELA
jgi:hypothetical protein